MVIATPRKRRPLTASRFFKSCCSWIFSCLLWLIMILFFVFAVLLVYWGILVGTSNRIIDRTMIVIAGKFGDQIEFLMRQIFVAMHAVVRKMKIQLDVHLHTLDPDVRRIFQNALQGDSALLRNLQAPIIASEQLVYGLGYFYRPTEGSMSFLARISPNEKSNQPMYVLRNQDDKLLAERYIPERVDKTEVLIKLPDVRAMFSHLIPKKFPHWMEPTTIGEIVPIDMDLDLGAGAYLIAYWDNYTLPQTTNITASSVTNEAGYIVTVTPVEAFHQIFKMLSNELPITLILIETDTLIMVANNVESLTSKIRAPNYHHKRIVNPVVFLNSKYGGNMSEVPEGLVQYKDDNRTGSHIYVKHLQEPYKWTLILVVDEELLDTWDRVVLIMLGIAAALSLIASIPICLIAQCYVHSRDYVREVYGEEHLHGKIVESSPTPPSAFTSIYPQ